MSENPVEAHAADALTSASAACTSPMPEPPMSSSPMSVNSTLALNEDGLEDEVVTSVLTQQEAAAIKVFMAPPQDTSLWVTGKKFYEVPSQPLIMTNMHQSKDWYAVYKGFWVSVVTSSHMANTATDGMSGSSKKGFKSQQVAVQAFNEALEDQTVAIIFA